MRCLVVGAGVAGLTTALSLVERGATVEVVDRGSHLGARSCSWFAGGMLAPWCERESADEAVLRRGLAALAWWRERFPETVAAGTLVVAPARDGAELERFSRRTSGFDRVGPDAIATLEPALAGRFSRGLHFPHEGHLDPRRALAALARCLAEAGVPIRFDTDVTDFAIDADRIFDCRGFAAREQRPPLTPAPALRGVKGEMLLVRSTEISLSRPVRLLHPRMPLYVVPRGDGLFMIGATMIESEERSRITARSMMELLGGAFALHPAFGEAEIVEVGTDVRPAYRDNLPAVDVDGRMIRINGLYRHGFLLSPWCAQRAVAAAYGEPWEDHE